jgi:hypothetical protein
MALCTGCCVLRWFVDTAAVAVTSVGWFQSARYVAQALTILM